MMRNLLKLLPFFSIGIVSLGVVSCSEEEDSCEIVDDEFKPDQCVNADISVCSGDETYYIFNGVKYDANGNLIEGESNNSSDLSDLVLACDPNATETSAMLIQLKLDIVTEQLLIKAKTAAICK